MYTSGIFFVLGTSLVVFPGRSSQSRCNGRIWRWIADTFTAIIFFYWFYFRFHTFQWLTMFVWVSAIRARRRLSKSVVCTVQKLFIGIDCFQPKPISTGLYFLVQLCICIYIVSLSYIVLHCWVHCHHFLLYIYIDMLLNYYSLLLYSPLGTKLFGYFMLLLLTCPFFINRYGPAWFH